MYGVDFTSDARLSLLGALADANGNEVLLRGEYDSASRRITAVTPVAYGNAHRAMNLGHLFSAGSFHLHSHPTGSATPSDADLDCAERLAIAGVGFAVVNHNGSELHVVTLPRRIPPEYRPRYWRVGRLAVMWHAGALRCKCGGVR